MSTFKINLYCNDSLLPSTSDKNTSKYTEWVYDGSGSVSLYVNQRSLDILQDVSSTPKYIWLLESKQIKQNKTVCGLNRADILINNNIELMLFRYIYIDNTSTPT